MIDTSRSPRQRIIAALTQAGEIGLTVGDVCTATQLENYVVLYTLRNMKAAGQVGIAAGAEPYQHDRHWVLIANPAPRAPSEPFDPDGEFTRLEKANRELIDRLSAVHPHGHENARHLPKAPLMASRIA